MRSIKIDWGVIHGCLDVTCINGHEFHVDTEGDLGFECPTCGDMVVPVSDIPTIVLKADNQTEEIVAWACGNCDMAIECNARDDKGELLSRIPLERCPVCGGLGLAPLTAKAYAEAYGDD